MFNNSDQVCWATFVHGSMWTHIRLHEDLSQSPCKLQGIETMHTLVTLKAKGFAHMLACLQGSTSPMALQSLWQFGSKSRQTDVAPQVSRLGDTLLPTLASN